MISDTREQLESELAWRIDELRHLRNGLLGTSVSKDDWPVHSMRALIVMQYAHLEGFTQAALSLYVEALNSASVPTSRLRPELFSTLFAQEFVTFLAGSGEIVSEVDRAVRRAHRQVDFVQRLRAAEAGRFNADPERVVRLEMNLGREMLKKNFYFLGIPEDSFDKPTYGAVEFFRTIRNDIAHGSRRDRIEPGLFDAHWEKCEAYMRRLVVVLTRAIREEWYLDPRGRGVSTGQIDPV